MLAGPDNSRSQEQALQKAHPMMKGRMAPGYTPSLKVCSCTAGAASVSPCAQVHAERALAAGQLLALLCRADSATKLPDQGAALGRQLVTLMLCLQPASQPLLLCRGTACQHRRAGAYPEEDAIGAGLNGRAGHKLLPIIPHKGRHSICTGRRPLSGVAHGAPVMASTVVVAMSCVS